MSATSGEWKYSQPGDEFVISSIWNDDQGRRCTSFIAVLNSADQDNHANARLMAASKYLRAAVVELRIELLDAKPSMGESLLLRGINELLERTK